MFIKPRFESAELKLLSYLNPRMSLPNEVANYYSSLEKGYIGEQMFDKCLKSLTNDWLILNDLLFESHNTVFQIDSLLLS
jgi:hypothetical protein